MSRAVRLPDAADLAAARDVVRAHLVPTPLIAAPELGERVWLKVETAQPTGAFKVRGALAALSALPAGDRAVTPSAGNHGLGMAWAAGKLGRDVTIVCAENASPAKLAALRALGADLVLHGASYDEAEAHALTLDGTFVSGYNDRHVIAGQATIGAELPDGPLCVVTPAGGGGLLSGLVAWARERTAGTAGAAAGGGAAPDAWPTRVVGVEAERSRALSAAVCAGKVIPVEVGETLADGLAGNLEPGSVTVAGAAGAELVAVSEAELRAAMRALARHHGRVVEGAAAVAYAAVATGRAAPRDDERLVVVLTGRNVALPVLAEVLADAD